MKKRPPAKSKSTHGVAETPQASWRAKLVFAGVLVGLLSFVVWGLWPRQNFTPVPAAAAVSAENA